QAAGVVIPAGSLLARWQTAPGAAEKKALGAQVQELLLSGSPAKDGPNAALYRQLTSLSGPLFRKTLGVVSKTGATAAHAWGGDPDLFGKHPNGTAIDAASVCVRAPSVLA